MTIEPDALDSARAEYRVHNHGTEEGMGIGCHEQRVGGHLLGECLLREAAHRDDNEYVWLIERGDPPSYENATRTGWTGDPYAAHRYGSKAEAEDQIRHRIYTAEAVEHGFIPSVAEAAHPDIPAANVIPEEPDSRLAWSPE